MSTTDQPAGRDFAAVTTWEVEREAAEGRGERWVDAAGHLAALVKAATTHALQADVPAAWGAQLVGVLVAAVDEYTERRSAFTSWAVRAWSAVPCEALPASRARPPRRRCAGSSSSSTCCRRSSRHAGERWNNCTSS